MAFIQTQDIDPTHLGWNSVACPVCRTSDSRCLFEDYNRREKLPIRSRYVTCVTCGMIYLSPMPEWQEFRKYYEWLYSAQSSEIANRQGTLPADRKGRLASVLKFLRRFRFRPHSWPEEEGRGRNLLEVGCGDGIKLKEFVERGWKVVGVDISAKALEQARGNVPSGEFHKGELGQVHLMSHSFHVVRLDNVLEHMPNPSEIIAQCAQLLVEGEGRMFFYVPHGHSLSMRLLGRYSNNSWIPFHLNLFNPPALRRMLPEAGFRRVEIHTYSPIHALPASLLQMLGHAGDPRGWGRLQWPIYLGLAPLGWMADRLGMGEELIAVARV